MKDTDNLAAVQRMQSYIDGHLQERISLKDLANAAEYSPWHAARLFKEATGKAPFEYIRARRLTQAALIIRDQDEKILDVALDFVFDSHEGFTRAFSKAFGILPSTYSQTTPPIPLFLPQKVYDTYKALNKGGSPMKDNLKTQSVFVQVIERPARKLLLKRGTSAKHYFEYCEEVGCDVWSVLTSVKEALFEPIGLWLPKHLITPGTSLYVQGVEVPLAYSNLIPEGFELIELPPCTLMIFQGEPYDDENFQEEIGLIFKHIEKFDPKIYGYEWDPEAAPRFQLAPEGYRGYIEARPVKRMDQVK